MKNIANWITASRILAAICLLFTPEMSTAFFVLYTYCGVSDMVDGTIARLTQGESAWGARLDSIADLVFLLAAAVKLLPALIPGLPSFCLFTTLIILCIRLLTFAIGKRKFQRYLWLHTYLNKAAGGVIFLLPYGILLWNKGYLLFCCMIVLCSAIEELFCVVKMKQYQSDTKGLWSIHHE